MNTILQYIIYGITAFAFILVLTDSVKYGFSGQPMTGVAGFINTLATAIGQLPLWALSMIVYVILALIDTILNLIFKDLLGLSSFSSSIGATWLQKGGIVKLQGAETSPP